MSSKQSGVNAVLQAVERRGDTDERPSFFTHVILPILLVLVGVGVAAGMILATAGYRGTIEATLAVVSSTLLGGAVVLLAATVLAAIVLAIVGSYQVMRRRRGHFARDHVLREGLLDYARSIAAERGGERVNEHIEAMERIHHDARIDEPDRPPSIHLLLILLFPFWYLYVVYYLTRDFADHARRQARFFREMHTLSDEAGLDVEETEAVAAITERSYLLVLLLVLIVPFGNLVVLYWLYNDPEEHFDHQWHHEDALVEMISRGQAADQARSAPSEETEAPDEGDVEPGLEGAGEQGQQPVGPGATEEEPIGVDATEQEAPSQEAEFTVWTCSECATKYKVPPKRPVRVTCKECENQEILEE